MKYTLFLTVLSTGLVLTTGCGKDDKDLAQPPSIDPAEKNSFSIPKATSAAKTEIQNAQQTVEKTVETYTVKAEEILSEMTEPIDSVKEKIASYSQPELLARASQYKQNILEKTEQLSGLTDQLKGLSMTDILGERGTALKENVASYTAQLSALKERYSIYLEKLEAMGVDLSALGL